MTCSPREELLLGKTSFKKNKTPIFQVVLDSLTAVQNEVLMIATGLQDDSGNLALVKELGQLTL